MKPYYEKDNIAIFHGDFREVDDWLSADAMVTDPPFGMDYKSGWSNRSIQNDGSTDARDECLRRWGDKPALVFGRWNCPHPQNTKMVLTWDKGDWPGMGDLKLPWGPSTEEIYVIGSGFIGKRSGSVIRIDRLTGDIIHPNEKPVPLLERLIDRCPPGVIADPFIGSGSTLIAAKMCGRRAIGVELEERYCEIAANRLSQGVLFGAGGAASGESSKSLPKNCYAMKMAGRLEAMGQSKCVGLTHKVNGHRVWTGKITLDDEALTIPLKRKTPTTWFVNSMSDLFHEGVPFEFVDKVFAVMALSPQHTFQILTKRPERMAAYLNTQDRPHVIAKAADGIQVAEAIAATPYEIRVIPEHSAYFATNGGEIYTTIGSGHCVWCGTVFDHGQQDSRYCKTKCRSDSHYAKKQGRNHEPAGAIMRKVKPDPGDDGHLRVHLIGNGRELVHRLILTTFDRAPVCEEQGCHWDGNPANNHVANLRWGTQSSNWEDRKRHGNYHSYGVRRNVASPIPWPLPNCWTGTSVEDQKRADERIPHLLRCPAAVRFLSVEPLLADVDLLRVRCGPLADHNPEHRIDCLRLGYWSKGWGYSSHSDLSRDCGGHGIDWVIVGGESGPGARPMNVEWARAIVRQCKEAGVAVFVKQMGANPVGTICECGDFQHQHQGNGPCGVCCQSRAPYDGCEAFRATGRTERLTQVRDPKGGDPAEWPEDLRIRQTPALAAVAK